MLSCHLIAGTRIHIRSLMPPEERMLIAMTGIVWEKLKSAKALDKSIRILLGPKKSFAIPWDPIRINLARQIGFLNREIPRGSLMRSGSDALCIFFPLTALCSLGSVLSLVNQ